LQAAKPTAPSICSARRSSPRRRECRARSAPATASQQFRRAGICCAAACRRTAAGLQQSAEQHAARRGIDWQQPADDIKLGKKHYREQNFGLAERHFRRAVEAAPQNAEAWMGLAASYDKLRRFDLADRAYNQALKPFAGATPELLNNHGYSYILRGDYKNARFKLAAAKVKAPNNQYVQNNIDLLEDSIRNAR
jgi:Flp pilus assembly protein TadD